jgi:perosamine synthetase
MEPLTELAEEHDLFMLEDCAEAHGAKYRDFPVGSIGDVGCFSFYGNKILTMGQGGIITTDNEKLAEKIILYRRDGMSHTRKYYHEVIGYNYRLTNMQAAIGVGQLERADEIIDEKRRVARSYREKLSDTSLRFQTEYSWASPTYWMNTPLFESETVRDRVIERLEENDIETRPFFYPLHKQPPYADKQEKTLPTCLDLYKRGVNLPSSPLLSEDDIDRICHVVRETVSD